MSLAEDLDAGRRGTIILASEEVIPIGEPLLLPEAEAQRWKPSDEPWWIRMAPAPGQSRA